MEEKLRQLEQEFKDIENLLADPAVLADQARLKSLAKRRSAIEPAVRLFQELQGVERSQNEAKILLDNERDADMKEMAKEEFESMKKKKDQLLEALKVELLPKDPNDQSDCIMEIRAGAGGDEAALFAGELTRMYMRYAENRRWKVELVSKSEAESGGMKEAILTLCMRPLDLG